MLIFEATQAFTLEHLDFLTENENSLPGGMTHPSTTIPHRQQTILVTKAAR